MGREGDVEIDQHQIPAIELPRSCVVHHAAGTIANYKTLFPSSFFSRRGEMEGGGATRKISAGLLALGGFLISSSVLGIFFIIPPQGLSAAHKLLASAYYFAVFVLLLFGVGLLMLSVVSSENPGGCTLPK
ncbi:hypothetical protein COCNU_12G003620 [Cocos nucifera]|uniref:Transmembrane protein n=1 Tax=Cocos nucifera TaxID=13894 RepID=A0A8K0IR90_COCNU|nr:hypothetical protein COCNU_12G003620 [Cocos nucifera]